MSGHPYQASLHANPPLPPFRSADVEKMTSSHHKSPFGAITNQPGSACMPNGGSSMTPGTSVVPVHAFQQHHVRRDIMQRNYLPDRQEQMDKPNMHSTMPVVHNPPPPGMYPTDINAPRRPPMITEETIRSYKEGTMRIGNFIREHNKLNQEDPYMQYRWYGTDKTDGRITTTLLAIIEDTAHAIIPHLYSRFTYNDAQRRDCASMELMVARVASNEMFDPLTQTLRSFGIRKLIQDKMAMKKKTRDRKQKWEGQNNRQNDFASSGIIPDVPHSGEANLTVPAIPSEMQAISHPSDPLMPTEAVNDEPNHPPRQTENGQMQRTDLSAGGGLEAARENSVAPNISDATAQPAAEVRIQKDATLPSSTARGKSGSKRRSKVKKIKGKKQASNPTSNTPTCVVRPGTGSELNMESNEHRNSTNERCRRTESVAESTSKSRKRKRTGSESSGHESMPNSTDSEDREAELAELKKRMKEIERRKTKKKGKKNRSR